MSLLLLGAGSVDAFSPNQLTGFFAEFNPSRSLASGNLWQNTAKTIAATANNDPVRVVRDPLSGVEWAAPSDAARGLLKISGPYAWIELDGSDDVYRTTNVPTVTAGFTVGSAFFQDVRSPYTANLAGLYSMYNINNENSVQFRIANTTLQAGGTSAITGGFIALDTWYSATATYSPSAGVIRLNGTQTASGTVNVVQGTTNPAIGADFIQDARYLAGGIANIVLFSTVLSSENLALINTYLRGFYA